MKKIITGFHNLYYEVVYNSYYGKETIIYSKYYSSRKKYFIFGPIIKVEKYLELFKLDLDIESYSFSKAYIMKSLLDRLDDLEAKSKRENEIKKGELV